MTNDENIALLKELQGDERFVVQQSITTDPNEATGYTVFILDTVSNKTHTVHDAKDWPTMRNAIEQALNVSRTGPTIYDIMAYDLIIFDMDGTLTRHIIGDKRTGHFRAHAHDWKLLPGRYDAIHMLREEHKQIAIATNQGSAAYNIMHPNDIKRAIDDAAYFLGIYLVYICFDHPNGKNEKWAHESNMRKPAPGMLYRAMEDAHTEPGRTLFVGDREEDALAARAAGCNFWKADEFFALLALPPAKEDYPF